MQSGHTAQQRIEGNLPLDARQWSAETEVAAPREGNVAVICAAQIETVWIGEALWIAVGGSHDHDHRLALANALPAQFGIFGSQAIALDGAAE